MPEKIWEFYSRNTGKVRELKANFSRTLSVREGGNHGEICAVLSYLCLQEAT